MPWFKVDDRLHSHPKTMQAGTPAMGLWVLAGSWSMANLTDGWLPRYAALRLDPEADTLAGQLVAAGYWTEDTVDGVAGWRFHGWADYQPTKAQVESKREDARERMRRARTQGGSVRANSAETSRAVTPTPTRPDPSPTTTPAADAAADVFDAFWSAYPRKVGKGQARKAYNGALRKADADTILAGVRRYATSVAGSDPKYVAHPSTWLNGERWGDELQVPGQTSVDDQLAEAMGDDPEPDPVRDPEGHLAWRKRRAARRRELAGGVA